MWFAVLIASERGEEDGENKYSLQLGARRQNHLIVEGCAHMHKKFIVSVLLVCGTCSVTHFHILIVFVWSELLIHQLCAV
jgi:hypothetical protein